ncbi:MAG: hypothetical protein HY903_07750 [Deltaproteobacteria bacterium]|nr:hypothetical protein [Deltaproteobacteria bacterium]
MRPDLQHRADFVERLAFVGAAIAAFFALFYTTVFASFEGAAVLAVAALALSGCGALQRRGGSPSRVGNLALAVIFAIVSYVASLRDDLPIAPMAYFTLLPLVASYIAGGRSARVWTAVASVVAVGFAARFATDLAYRRLSPSPEQIIAADTSSLVALFVLVWQLARVIGDRRRRAEIERQATFTSMQRTQRFESIGRLVGGVAHEINNPLACVISNLEFVVADTKGQLAATRSPPGGSLDRADAAKVTAAAERLEALEDALRGAARVRRVIADLKQYGEREEGTPAALAVDTLIEWVVSLATPEVRPRAALSAECFESATVLASRGRLAQTLISLILYLADLMPEETRSANAIRVGAGTDGDLVVLTIEATTPPSDSRRTTPLIRLAGPAADGAVRPGVSIAVSADIVASLGGTLTIEPATGQVRRFVIRLPGYRA